MEAMRIMITFHVMSEWNALHLSFIRKHHYSRSFWKWGKERGIFICLSLVSFWPMWKSLSEETNFCNQGTDQTQLTLAGIVSRIVWMDFPNALGTLIFERRYATLSHGNLRMKKIQIEIAQSRFWQRSHDKDDYRLDAGRWQKMLARVRGW